MCYNSREFVLTTVILPPGVGYPGSVLAGLTPFPPHPVQNSWRLDSMRRRGASAAFARNPELQIGFGTLCELILGGLAPKGPKRQPQAVQRLFKNGSKEPKGWIRGAQGTQKAATGSPRAPQREPKGFRELSLYIYISATVPLGTKWSVRMPMLALWMSWIN